MENGATLIISPELLNRADQQLGAGMTGSSDGAPYSATGAGELSQSSADDPAPIEYLDTDGWGEGPLLGINLEDAVESLLDIGDVIDAIAGRPLGPVLVIPAETLRRWTNQLADEA